MEAIIIGVPVFPTEISNTIHGTPTLQNRDRIYKYRYCSVIKSNSSRMFARLMYFPQFFLLIENYTVPPLNRLFLAPKYTKRFTSGQS